MTQKELCEEVDIEIELIATTLSELLALDNDIGEKEPTLREKTATASFLSQFYNGIENILKRISRFHSVSLPSGNTWHIELFKRFCEPPYNPLPVLFNGKLASSMASFRKFRHIVHHGYGFQLEWKGMKEGIAIVQEVFLSFKAKVYNYLEILKNCK